tara:strand:+ start:163 stop:594 length:432 start_codon:yes stop_codon:yes gene_type:complete
MNKAIQITIGAVALLGGGTGLFFYLRGKKANQNDEDRNLIETIRDGATSLNNQPTAGCVNWCDGWGLGHDRFPLRKGSYGQRVYNLQRYLVQSGSYYVGADGPDGMFGDNTKDAVIQELSPPGTIISTVSESYYNEFIAYLYN